MTPDAEHILGHIAAWARAAEGGYENPPAKRLWEHIKTDLAERDDARADVRRAVGVLAQFLAPAHTSKLSINEIRALLDELQRKYTEAGDE